MAIGATKIVTGTVLTGLVGGGATAGIYLLNNYSTVKDRLASEGFNTTVTDDEWTTILSSHNATGSTNVFVAETGKDKNKEWLKEKCKEALDKKDEKSYKSARQWCAKTQAISDILKAGKRKVLETDDSKSDDNTIWISKLADLSKDEKGKTKITITWNKEENERIKEIKAKCKTIVAVKNKDKTFDEQFELAKKWCSTETA